MNKVPFRWIPLCNNGPSESQADVTKGTRGAEESSESVAIRFSKQTGQIKTLQIHTRYKLFALKSDYILNVCT